MIRSFFGMLFIVCCLAWPVSADQAEIQPIVRYDLPADIMKVEFAQETWVYRLYEDGTVKKMISTRDATDNAGLKAKKNRLADVGPSFLHGNPFLGVFSGKSHAQTLMTENV